MTSALCGHWVQSRGPGKSDGCSALITRENQRTVLSSLPDENIFNHEVSNRKIQKSYGPISGLWGWQTWHLTADWVTTSKSMFTFMKYGPPIIAYRFISRSWNQFTRFWKWLDIFQTDFVLMIFLVLKWKPEKQCEDASCRVMVNKLVSKMTIYIHHSGTKKIRYPRFDVAMVTKLTNARNHGKERE